MPYVDIVIPIHSLSRPIERAVASVDDGLVDSGDVRVTVVCHGIAAEAVAGRLPSHVRVLELADGVPSAAGPVNLGIAEADAEYVCRLDSDDFFEPGALQQWIAQARAHAPDVLLARLRRQGEPPLPTPLTRLFRTRRLDPVKDRLLYRTNPLGLVRLEALKEVGVPFTPGLQVGEDLEVGLALWFGGLRVDFAESSPCYVVADDVDDRTTLRHRAARDELAAVWRIVSIPWVSRLPLDARRAIAIKVVRAHVLVLLKRNRQLTKDDSVFLRQLSAELGAFAPGYWRPFSRADRIVIDELRHVTGYRAALVGAVDEWLQSRYFASILTPRLRDNFHRESTFRRFLRQKFVRS